MAKPLVIVGIVVGVIGAAAIGTWQYIEYDKRKKALKKHIASITINKVDWKNHAVYFSFFVDGKKIKDSIINWTNLNIDKERKFFTAFGSSVPYDLYYTNQHEKLVLQPKYEGQPSGTKYIVDFKNNTIKNGAGLTYVDPSVK